METISKDANLSMRLAVFADPQCGTDRQIKGASNFLRCLVRMAEQNADRKKHGRRSVIFTHGLECVLFEFLF